MKPARKARSGSRSVDRHKGKAMLGGKTVTKPPRLKPGQVRCHACRNATTLTTTGAYRSHSDLFGGPCDSQRPQPVALDDLPPVLYRGEPVNPSLDRDRPANKGKGNGVRLYGDCEDCGAFVTGERRFCGMCMVRHDEARRRDT